MEKTIIGIVGFKNTGKDTVGKFLVHSHGFKKDSFAAPLKDAISAIFGYDRKAMEGDGEYDRVWREKIEPWWANKLDISDWTPRKAMQTLGTDVLRNCFHNNIWIDSLEHRLIHSSTDRFVITDCRFRNEIDLITKMGGKIIRVKRGDDPWWFEKMGVYNSICDDGNFTPPKGTVWDNIIPVLKEVHPSERDWVGVETDYEIEHNGTIDDLSSKVQLVMEDLGLV